MKKACPTKPAPGPWTHGRSVWRDGCYRIDGVSADGESPFIALGGSASECGANARQISASPELVAACWACYGAICEMIDSEQPTSTQWANMRAAGTMAAAAAVKATTVVE